MDISSYFTHCVQAFYSECKVETAAYSALMNPDVL